MSKLKCAYMYDTQADPLPTRKEAEKKFSSKVLYGFGTHRVEKTPYAKSMHLVDRAFYSISEAFTAPRSIAAYSAMLVAFDDSIDEVFFTLAAMQNTLTKFSVDDQIISSMSDLQWKIDHLDRAHQAIGNDTSWIEFYRTKNIGDQQFLDYLPKREADVLDYSREVQRILDVYKSQLKALFSSGW